MPAHTRSAAAAGEARAAIEWEMRVPLATNRRILGDLALATGLGAAIGFLLVAIAIAAQGEWRSMAPLALGFGAAGLGLFVLGVLIMLVFFGNRMAMAFASTRRASWPRRWTGARASRTASRSWPARWRASPALPAPA